MIDILIAGIGGQGSVLAARVLAQAAKNNGWQVRSAETIGMAQRGGNVSSYLRMGDESEEVFSPLPAHGSVDVLIALEPGEGARNLAYLKPGGILVTARSGVMPVQTDAKKPPYVAQTVVEALDRDDFRLVVVDDTALLNKIGSRKALNIVMLASALKAADETVDGFPDSPLRGRIGLDEMRRAVETCVKERFVALNLSAIDAVEAR